MEGFVLHFFSYFFGYYICIYLYQVYLGDAKERNYPNFTYMYNLFACTLDSDRNN